MNAASRRSVSPAGLWAVAGLAMGLVAASQAAGPQGGGVSGAQVVNGQATITQQGSLTRITASNNAIINYHSFGVPQGHTLEFVQPGATSRVLNRVTGPDPSVIAGQLRSNGIVYIANPAGVYFARGAVVNVGGIYAAGGKIADADFLRGANQFSNLTGRVENHGAIVGREVALVGQRAANFGSISAPSGMVTIAAGDSVLVGEQFGQVFARVETSPGSNPGGTGVTQAGVIDAPLGRVALGAGDMYAVAIDHPGRTRARAITLQGGRGAAGGEASVVSVSGQLDAAGQGVGGRGGTVRVLGQNVGLFDAQIDASGPTGGGSVRIGGDTRGSGEWPKADAVFVSRGSAILADATVSGDGGSVVLWSEVATNYLGRITARGGSAGGDGGFVETSSKDWLLVAGSVSASAQHGRGGLWLLDPTTVNISSDPTTGGTLSGGVFTPGIASTTANVNVTELIAALQGGTSVTIETASPAAGDGDINFLVPFSAGFTTPVTLTLNAVRDINVSNAITIGSGSLTLAFNAGRDINIASAITTGSGNATFNATRRTNLNAGVSAGAGNIAFIGSVLTGNAQLSARDINFGGTVDAQGGGGQLDLIATGAIRFNGEVGGSAPLTGLTTAASGSTEINAPRIRGGTMVFNNRIVIEADTAIRGTTSVTFNSTIDSATGEFNDLQVNSPLTAFNGSVGGVSEATQLGLFRTNLTDGAPSDVTTLNAEFFRARVVDLRDQILLARNVVVRGLDSVTFGGSVRSTGGTARDLTINSPSTTFTSVVGGTSEAERIGTLLTTRTGTGADTTTISGSGINANRVDFRDDVRIATAATIFGRDLVSFGGRLDAIEAGPRDVTIDGLDVILSGDVGAQSRLGRLVRSAPSDPAGKTEFAGATFNAGEIIIGDLLTITSRNALISADTSIDLSQGVESQTGLAADLSLRAPSITIDRGVGSIRPLTGFGSFAAQRPLAATQSLMVLGSNLTSINAQSVIVSIPTRLDSSVTVNASQRASFDSVINSAAGLAHGLTVISPDTTFGELGTGAGGALGAVVTDQPGTTRFNGAVVASVIEARDSVTIAAPSITTSGDQTYQRAVLLSANTTLTGNNVTFTSTVNSSGSDRSLTINSGAGGTTRFDAGVGLVTPLASLTTNGDGRTLLNGGQVITSGAQNYGDAVVLGLATTLSGQSIIFGSTVNSDGIARSLTLNTTGQGLKSFGGVVGGTSPLASITTNSNGQTRINTASITTSGAQTFNDLVLLGTNVTLTGAGLTFNSGARSEFTNRELTLNSTGNSDTVLRGEIGGTDATQALASLTTNADGRTLIGGSVRTNLDQSYNDAVRVTDESSMVARNVSFNSTVDGSAAGATAGLTITTASTGATTFNQRVGGINPLGALSVGANGTTSIRASITTNRFMTFSNGARIAADGVRLQNLFAATQDNPGAGIAFNGTLNSEGSVRNLEVLVDTTTNATVGNPRIARIQFNGPVGDQLRLGTLRLGTDRTDSASAATIGAGLSPAGTRLPNYELTINVDNFVMGRGQKFTVLGDLTINASSATLGDVSALRNITVNAPSISILRRPAGVLLAGLPSGGQAGFVTQVFDPAVDIVAGGQITFSSAPSFIGTGNAPQVATPTGTGISSTLQSLAARSFGPLSIDLLNSGTTYLDVRASGPSNTNIATTIAGAAPRPSTTEQVAATRVLGAEQLEALAEIGIETPGVGRQELLDLLMGRGLLIDAPTGLSPIAGDRRITTSRLSPDVVDRVIKAYRLVMVRETIDPATGQVVRTRQDEPIRAAFDASWRIYAAAAGDRADAIGFRAYLEAVPTEAQTLFYLDGLRDLFGQIGTLGLTQSEVRAAKDTILQQVTPPSISREVLESAIESRILGDTPLTPMSMLDR